MTTALIVAAGRGTRMGPGMDKLFLNVVGRPVIAHTWELFERSQRIDDIILVVRDGMQAVFQELSETYGFRKPFRIVAGGDTRQDSVWNGLSALSPSADLVAIHDGARPCTAPATLEATLAAAREVGAAVTAQRVTDTIKESDGATRIQRTVDRSRLWAVQTPQVFQVSVIREALRETRARGIQVTDDTAACEWIGQPVALVESPNPNPKVTLPADLDYVGLLLSRAAAVVDH